VGTASPFNFNGLVRHYYLRQGANMADIQVNLVEKGHRRDQSHAIAKRMRPSLKMIADRFGARVKVAEVPPGPPVLSTLVAEVYGPDYERQRKLAEKIRHIFETTPDVVDVDWYMEAPRPRFDLVVDRERAALHNIPVARITKTLEMALSGRQVGLLHQVREKEDVPIVLRLPLSTRSGVQRLENLKISGADGTLVPLSALVKTVQTEADRSIHHKNLMPVVYVTGDVAGARVEDLLSIKGMSESRSEELIKEAIRYTDEQTKRAKIEKDKPKEPEAENPLENESGEATSKNPPDDEDAETDTVENPEIEDLPGQNDNETEDKDPSDHKKSETEDVQGSDTEDPPNRNNDETESVKTPDE